MFLPFWCQFALHAASCTTIHAFWSSFTPTCTTFSSPATAPHRLLCWFSVLVTVTCTHLWHCKLTEMPGEMVCNYCGFPVGKEEKTVNEMHTKWCGRLAFYSTSMLHLPSKFSATPRIMEESFPGLHPNMHVPAEYNVPIQYSFVLAVKCVW